MLAPATAGPHTTGIVWPHSVIPLGCSALTVDLAALDGDVARAVVRGLAGRLTGAPPAGLLAVVPAIRTVTVHYDPTQTTIDALEHHIAAALDTVELILEPPRDPVIIPVCYGGEFGPDLEFVATTHHTTPEAIVAAHTAGRYTVAMLGFLPGFPYLDGLAASLHTPRRATPRLAVPAGSVGIGGASTGIYPCTSPGGWQLIGRTHRALFDPARMPPTLLQPGDVVQFVSIPTPQPGEALHRS